MYIYAGCKQSGVAESIGIITHIIFNLLKNSQQYYYSAVQNRAGQPGTWCTNSCPED